MHKYLLYFKNSKTNRHESEKEEKGIFCVLFKTSEYFLKIKKKKHFTPPPPHPPRKKNLEKQ